MADSVSNVETKDELPQSIVDQLQLEELPYTEDSLRKSCNSIYNRFVKRWIGFFIALVMLIILSPVYIVVSLCIVIESGFPVFYRAERGGYKWKSFRIFKFRSMVKDADKIGGGTTALGDKRITRVGALLRKTKLDEIAQLFNVINGTMSFIGERGIIETTEKSIDFSRVVAG